MKTTIAHPVQANKLVTSTTSESNNRSSQVDEILRQSMAMNPQYATKQESQRIPTVKNSNKTERGQEKKGDAAICVSHSRWRGPKDKKEVAKKREW